MEPNKTDAKWPEDDPQLFISAFYQDGDEPFIYGVRGKATTGDLREIEREALQDAIASEKHHGDGEYLFRVYYEESQYEDGVCTIPGGYCLEFAAYRLSSDEPF